MNQICHALVVWVVLVFVSAWEPDVCQEVHIRSQILEKSRILVRDGRGFPANIRNVTLLNQISKTICIKWDNFGYAGFTVAVENGCEGTFSVCYISGIRTPETTLTTTTECTNVRLVSKVRVADEKLITQYIGGGDLIVSMDLLQQLSAVSCVKGLSFNYYDNKVEARFGCRGDFRVCVDTFITLNAIVPAVKCEVYVLLSRVDLEEKLTVPLSYGGIVSMIMVEEYSTNVCSLGQTFGFNKNHGLEIYARNGCQAVFDVCQSPDDLLPPKLRGEVI